MPNRRRFTDDQENDIVAAYLAGKSTNHLAALYGSSETAVRNALQRHGVACRTTYGAQGYSLNVKAFDACSAQADYWLGFILAEGHLTDNRLSVELSVRDSQHLESLRAFLQSDAPIRIQTRYNPRRGKTYQSARLDICSVDVASDLEALGMYRPTILGLKATRAVLPLSLAAGFAQLLRDLLSLDESDGLLARWQPLDHLIVLELLSERSPRLRAFSEALVEQVDVWMEANPDRIPVLYQEWIVGDQGTSRACEVVGSLGLTLATRKIGNGHAWARKEAYAAVLRSIILFELGQGTPVEDLERQWKLTGLSGIQERWRDDHLWLLSGLARILDLRCFYYHLREECNSDVERIRRVKRLLRIMCVQTYELQEHVKYCSPLGPVLRSMRRAPPGADHASVGLRSIRCLEEAGIRSIVDLSGLALDDLVKLGIRRDRAKQIHSYARCRLQ